MTRRGWARALAAGAASLGSAWASQTVLRGAGATFPDPLYQKWFAAFAKRFPAAQVDYSAIGSGAGVDLLAAGSVDFAATDHPLSKDALAAMPRRIRQWPTVVGGVVPIYRLEDVALPVRFTPDILAGIYLGRVRRWNDPALRAANRGVALPSAPIGVVHRADRSGTTFVWTEYLSKVSEDWKKAVGAGDQVEWPVQGLAAKGSAGVLEAVAAAPNSFGYVEFIYGLDRRVSAGLIRNRAGKYVRADLLTLAAAAAGADAETHITDAPGDESYPVSAFTYILAPEQFDDAGKKAAMRDLLNWILTSGQKQCAALGYAALPPQIAAEALRRAISAAP